METSEGCTKVCYQVIPWFGSIGTLSSLRKITEYTMMGNLSGDSGATQGSNWSSVISTFWRLSSRKPDQLLPSHVRLHLAFPPSSVAGTEHPTFAL